MLPKVRSQLDWLNATNHIFVGTSKRGFSGHPELVMSTRHLEIHHPKPYSVTVWWGGILAGYTYSLSHYCPTGCTEIITAVPTVILPFPLQFLPASLIHARTKSLLPGTHVDEYARGVEPIPWLEVSTVLVVGGDQRVLQDDICVSTSAFKCAVQGRCE